MGATQCEVKVKLLDGDVVLRLDFNAIDHIQEHLGQGIGEFFAGLSDEGATSRMLNTSFLRSVFYAGLLWTVPDGEAPDFTEMSIGRRMDLSRLAEYGEKAVELFMGSFGLKPAQEHARKQLAGNRKTRRTATSKRSRKNPT